MKRLILAALGLLLLPTSALAQGQLIGNSLEQAVRQMLDKTLMNGHCCIISDSATPIPTPVPAPEPVPTPAAQSSDKKWSGFVEAAGTLKPGVHYGGANLSVAKGNWWAWVQVEPGFQQAYAGPRFNLGPVEVGIGVGAKNTDNHWQTGAYDFYAKGRFSQLNLWERGSGGGWWFRNESNVAVTKRFSVGAFGQRNAGWGVRAGLKFRRSELWGAVLEQRSHERPNHPTFLLGLRRNF